MATLRARKHRPAKPLAVMLPVADGLPDAARQLLTTPAAPIVLVDKKYVPELCDDIAPDLNEVGVMLPWRTRSSICCYRNCNARW